jgi:hypothetical protein
MNKLNYGSNTPIYTPGDAKALFKTTMREKFKGHGLNFMVWKDQVVIKLSKNTFFKIIEDTLENIAPNCNIPHPQINHTYYTTFSVEFTLGNFVDRTRDIETLLENEDLIRVQVDLNYDEDGFEFEPDSPANATQEILIANIDVFGHPDLVTDFVASFKHYLKADQEAEKSALVNWVFTSPDGSRDKTFQIKKTWYMHSAYYPWITTDLVDYYKAFMASKSQILVLYGPPGTGKTSFIRDMLCEMNLNSYISYDLKILTADSTFVEYVTGSIFDAIVIEDADDLLTSDREEQNKIISKILNVGDGLIKLPRKKMIFSTNLSNVSDIDRAIIRPGRCFDVMEFRELTRPEAESAAEVLGTSLSEDKNSYSLAEIFMMKDIQESTDPFARKHGIKKTSIGFL